MKFQEPSLGNKIIVPIDYSLKGTSIADYYRDGNGKPYKSDFVGNRGYSCVRILEFLNGKPFNNVAMGYIHGFHPTKIRVSTGSVCTDARTGRVTVMLEQDNKTIKYIEQEIEIAGANGHDLRRALHGDFSEENSLRNTVYYSEEALKSIKEW